MEFTFRKVCDECSVLHVNQWCTPVMKRIVKLEADDCAGLLEVARGLCEQLSAPVGTPALGRAISLVIICSKMVGALTENLSK